MPVPPSRKLILPPIRTAATPSPPGHVNGERQLAPAAVHCTTSGKHASVGAIVPAAVAIGRMSRARVTLLPRSVSRPGIASSPRNVSPPGGEILETLDIPALRP